MRRKACIVKRGDRWAVKQPLPDGRYRWRTVGTRKKDAERLRDELNRRVAMGAAYREEPQRFEAFADAWLERYRQRVARPRMSSPRLPAGISLPSMTASSSR